MSQLLITRIKPNPRGKDKPRSGPIPASELAAEWVDIKNTSTTTLSLTGVSLFHRAYDHSGGADWALVTRLSGELRAGETLRVHSGEHRPISVVRTEDQLGAELHTFTADDRYVWNNRQADQPALTYNDQWLDRTGYDPRPPEGAVLIRSGAKLVVVAATAAW